MSEGNEETRKWEGGKERRKQKTKVERWRKAETKGRESKERARERVK